MNETQNFYMYAFGFIILGVFIVLAITNIILRDPPGDNQTPDEEEAEEAEYQHTQINATVVDMACSVEVKGTKTVKAVKTFRVVFQSEDGAILTLTIPEEMYEGIEVGQTGKLTLVDGELYGFEM